MQEDYSELDITLSYYLPLDIKQKIITWYMIGELKKGCLASE